jgi:protein SCO1/2
MTSFHDTSPGPGHSRLPLLQPTRRRMAALGAGLVAAAGVGGWAARSHMTAVAASRRGTPLGRIPDVPLVTHEGRHVRFYSDLVKGRVVFVSMMYAQCSDRCPPMTQNLKRVHEMLGDRAGRDVFMYSITLLPEYDRPADLKAFVDLNRIGPGWTFLTGKKDDIEQIRVGMGFSDPDPVLDADVASHIGMVRIGNEALDRWSMAPILSEPELILESLMAVDPVTQARGRRWARVTT